MMQANVLNLIELEAFAASNDGRFRVIFYQADGCKIHAVVEFEKSALTKANKLYADLRRLVQGHFNEVTKCTIETVTTP